MEGAIVAVAAPSSGAVDEAIHVARHPVHDAKMALYGYVLNIEPGVAHAPPGAVHDDSTATLITHTITDIGLNALVGAGKAVTTFPGEFWNGTLDLPVTADEVVLSVPEHCVAEPNVRASVDDFKQRGFTISVGGDLGDDAASLMAWARDTLDSMREAS